MQVASIVVALVPSVAFLAFVGGAIWGIYITRKRFGLPREGEYWRSARTWWVSQVLSAGKRVSLWEEAVKEYEVSLGRFLIEWHPSDGRCNAYSKQAGSEDKPCA